MSHITTWIAENRNTLIILAVLITLFLVLRSQASAIPQDDITTVVGQGQPVVLDFFSNT